MKNVRKLFWINLFNNFFWLSSVITFFYLQRGLSYAEILSLGAIMGISILLFEVPTGLFADKFGRKKSIIMSSVFFLLSMGIYLIADNFMLFSISFMLLGFGITFASGSIEALIYDSLKSVKKEHQMKKRMGQFFSAEVLAGTIIPPIASIIAKELLPPQFDILIYLTLISYFISLIIIFTLKDISIHDKSEIKSSFFDNLKLMRKNKKLLVFIFNKAFVATAMLSYMFLWQPQFKLSNIPIIYFGIFLSIGSLGIFFVNRNIEKLSKIFSVKHSLIISSVIPALGFLILAYVFNPILSVILYLLIRIISSMRDPIFSELINKELSSNNRAALLSVISMISGILTFIFRPIIGILSDIDIRYGFIFLGILCLISAFAFPIKSHHISPQSVTQ